MDYIKWLGQNSSEIEAFTERSGLELHVAVDGSGRRFLGIGASGIDVTVEADHIISSVIFSLEDGLSRGTYKGVLPSSLKRGMNSDRVHSILGRPLRSSGPMVVPFLGMTNAWDAFAWESRIVRVLYNENRSCLSQVTVMEKDLFTDLSV